MEEGEEEVIIGEMMGPTLGAVEAMAIMQGITMTITEEVVAMTGEITMEVEGVVDTTTGTTMADMTTMRTVSSSKATAGEAEEVSGTTLHHIRAEVEVVAA